MWHSFGVHFLGGILSGGDHPFGVKTPGYLYETPIGVFIEAPPGHRRVAKFGYQQPMQ